MNKKTFLKLCANYNKPLNEDLYELWKQELYMWSEEEMEIAFRNIMFKEQYFPTLSKVIEELLNIPYKKTDNEKIKMWEKKGIKPDWLGKNIE